MLKVTIEKLAHSKQKILQLAPLNILLLTLFNFSCTHNKIEHVERAIYYWKSDSRPTEKETAIVDSIGMQKLYIKFFEVDRNEEMGNFPIAKTDWWRYSVDEYRTIEKIPTVYLKNSVFLKSSKEELDQLADNVNFLVTKYCKEKFYNLDEVKEFQMDCDWTLKSRDNYFYFLQKLKSISSKKLSCTLRLYPYKYPNKMGVPPVDKAMLMCYNLLNPLENQEKNSILDLDELKSYVKGSTQYPLHLDIALPVYSWAQVYHNELFSAILYSNFNELKKVLKKDSDLWYSVTSDTLVGETFLRVGDKIKYESTDAQKINAAITILKKHLKFDSNTTVALFHLDEKQLSNFTNEELSTFYTSFSN